MCFIIIIQKTIIKEVGARERGRSERGPLNDIKYKDTQTKPTNYTNTTNTQPALHTNYRNHNRRRRRQGRLSRTAVRLFFGLWKGAAGCARNNTLRRTHRASRLHAR